MMENRVTNFLQPDRPVVHCQLLRQLDNHMGRSAIEAHVPTFEASA